MPKPSSITKIVIFCALPCEAKPLIGYYKLKKDTSVQAFSIFRNENIVLTVTGIGKCSMAAGIAYTQALFSPQPIPVMLNIGIAGHQAHPIGGLFLADKITDAESGRNFYPPLVFAPPCPTASLQTHARPQSVYHENALCDMEGAAFYETATRFSTGELCHCLKVVSDNALSPAQKIDANLAAALIQANLGTVQAIIKALAKLADGLAPLNHELMFTDIIQHYRFSVSEQIQLQKQLSRWSVLNGETELDIAAIGAKTAKEFLALLDQKLNDLPFHL